MKRNAGTKDSRPLSELGRPMRDMADTLQVRVRRRMEAAARKRISEHVHLRLHDGLYTPLRRGLSPLPAAMLKALSADLGLEPKVPPREERRHAIANLRAKLDEGAQERELQRLLVKSGLLAITCRAVQEVTMRSTNEHPEMRMDLLIGSSSGEPAQVIELKRGSHLLLAYRGKPTERLSRKLMSAVSQLAGYGDRLASDATLRESIEQLHGVQVEKPELRLVAGRRLADARQYDLIRCLEADADEGALQLRIQTWDGFLAELERIVG